MARRQPLRQGLIVPGYSSTAAERVSWLLASLWNGNRSEMARAAGVSHSVISRICLGQQNPGRRLLQALAGHPKVNPSWLLSGEGTPILADSREGPSEGWPIRVASQLLPGPLADHPHLLSGEILPVAGIHFRPSRFWYRISAWDPVVGAKNQHVAAGDLLLMESDPRAWQEPSLVDGYIAAVLLPNADGPALGVIRWSAGDAEESAELSVDMFSDRVAENDLIERLEILRYPGGKLELKRSLLRQVTRHEAPRTLEKMRNIQLARASTAIKGKHITAVCMLLVRLPA